MREFKGDDLHDLKEFFEMPGWEIVKTECERQIELSKDALVTLRDMDIIHRHQTRVEAYRFLLSLPEHMQGLMEEEET